MAGADAQLPPQGAGEIEWAAQQYEYQRDGAHVVLTGGENVETGTYVYWSRSATPDKQ